MKIKINNPCVSTAHSLNKDDTIVADDSQPGDYSSTVTWQNTLSNHPKDQIYMASNNLKKRENKK